MSRREFPGEFHTTSYSKELTMPLITNSFKLYLNNKGFKVRRQGKSRSPPSVAQNIVYHVHKKDQQDPKQRYVQSFFQRKKMRIGGGIYGVVIFSFNQDSNQQDLKEIQEAITGWATKTCLMNFRNSRTTFYVLFKDNENNLRTNILEQEERKKGGLELSVEKDPCPKLGTIRDPQYGAKVPKCKRKPYLALRNPFVDKCCRTGRHRLCILSPDYIPTTPKSKKLSPEKT